MCLDSGGDKGRMNIKSTGLHGESKRGGRNMEGLVSEIFIVSILRCLQSNVGELFKLLILLKARRFLGCQT